MSAIPELTKELRELDAQARLLRSEVARLEETSAAMQTAPPENEQHDESNGSALALVPFPQVDLSRPGGTRVPPELFDEMCALSGEVTYEMNENKRLQGELERLATVHAVGQKKNMNAQKSLHDMYAAAGWSPNENRKFKRPSELKDEGNLLKSQMVQLLEQRNAIQEAMARQNAEMEELMVALEGMKDSVATVDSYNGVLAEKKAELASIEDKINSTQRIIHQKDVMIAKEDGVDMASKLRSVEADKRVAQHRLVKEQDVVRQNELAIRHRALQIEKLQHRLELIGDAVGGDDTADEERVDVEHVDDLRKEIETFSRLQWDASMRVEVLDAEIENLQKQADGLTRVKAMTEKEKTRVAREHKRYTKLMEKELTVQQKVANDDLGQLEADIEVLRKTSTRRQNRRRLSAQKA